MNYDIAAGLDNQTLNTLVGQFYSALYPNLFKTVINVGQYGFASVALDINSAPTVDLSPSAAARKALTAALDKILDQHASGPHADDFLASKAKLLELAAAASLGLSAPSLALTINYSNGAPSTTVNASLQATVTVLAQTTGGVNSLTLQMATATLSIPDNPALESILNNGFVPGYLVPYLNTNILSPVQVPTLQFGSVQISLPVPAVETPFLVAYSALGATQPDIPAPGQWPNNCVFFATDAAALQAAAAIPFPLGPSDSFSWEIISGTVQAVVNAPQNISVNADGSLNATIVANASCQLTLHTPWPLPNVSFGPTATATISATLKPSVSNGSLSVAIEGFPIPTFDFDWGIPSWINWLFDPLEDALAAALNAVLGPLIGQLFSWPPIKVYTLPTISFSLSGQTIAINIGTAQTSGQSGLLVVAAQASIVKN